MIKKLFKNKLITIFIVIIILILLILITRFFVGGNEDNWICENGKIVKHGNPDYPPDINCQR
jgi:hypothetical protein